jgi:hypothetical protein
MMKRGEEEMSGIRFSFPASIIAGKACIERHDVLILRRYGFAEGIRRYDDARRLLALDAMCPAHCHEWKAYFVETLSAFIIDIAPPSGQLDPLKSAWLIRNLAFDGVIEHSLRLEFLLHAIERADYCPDILSAFALDQLRLACSRVPAGAYYADRPGRAGITAGDLDYVWRILRSAVDRGRLLPPPFTASILRAIDDLVRLHDNHPGWAEIIGHMQDGERSVESLRTRPWLMTADPTDDDVVARDIAESIERLRQMAAVSCVP